MTSIRICVSAVFTTALLLFAGLDSGEAAGQMEVPARGVGMCGSWGGAAIIRLTTQFGCDDSAARSAREGVRDALLRSFAASTRNYGNPVTPPPTQARKVKNQRNDKPGSGYYCSGPNCVAPLGKPRGTF
jgi:hypothetical protein